MRSRRSNRRVLVSARKFRELKASNAAQEIESVDPIEVIPRVLTDGGEEEGKRTGLTRFTGFPGRPSS